MDLREKISYLTERLMVSQQGLMRAVLLKQPAITDINLYISLYAVMADITRDESQATIDFVHFALHLTPEHMSFEECMADFIANFHSLNHPNEKAALVTKVFGTFYSTKALALIHGADVVKRLKADLG